MRRIFAISALTLLAICWSRTGGVSQSNDVAVITVNVTTSQPSLAEGLIPKIETINGKSLVKLSREENGQIVAIKAGTYILLKFDAASGAGGFEFGPPGIVEPPPGTYHLPKDVIGILQAVNPGTATIAIKRTRPHVSAGRRAAAGNGNPSGSSSPNWSGYVVLGGPFTRISGQWRVPRISQGSSVSGDGSSNSASWIGIDGDTNNSLIAVGTEQDWNSGVVGVGEGPSYYAWYEILPAAETRLPNQVQAFDVMYAEITQTDPSASTWSIQLVDTSLGWAAEIQVTYTGPLSSAEWIRNQQVEAMAPRRTRESKPWAPTLVQWGETVSSPSNPDPQPDSTNFEVGRTTTPDTGDLNASQSINMRLTQLAVAFAALI